MSVLGTTKFGLEEKENPQSSIAMDVPNPLLAGVNPVQQKSDQTVFTRNVPSSQTPGTESIQVVNSMQRAATPGETTNQPFRTLTPNLKLAFSVIVALVVIVVTVFMISQLGSGNNSGKKLNTSAVQGASDYESIRVKVEKQVSVPEGVTPKIYQVQDVAKAKAAQPEVFAQLEQGDYLAIYNEYSFIYRPSQDKVIAQITTQN